MKPILGALTLALTLLATATAPSFAATPDGAFARFALGGGRGGLVIVSYTGSTTVNAGTIGLVASQEYFLFGSSQGCGHMPSTSNRVFRLTKMTDADGVLWLRRSPSIAARIVSFWLGPTNGSSPPVCAISFNFERLEVATGDVNGDAVLGIWDKEHVLSLLVAKPHDQARLTLVIDTGSGDDEVTVRGVDRGCGKRPTQRFFDLGAELAVTGTFQTEMLSLTSDELGSIRSERAIFGDHTECANIIAVLIGL